MSYKDYYKILGVNADAATNEIEAAYDKLAARYSSEQFEDDDLTETILNNIDEAYMVLANPEWRSEYDSKGKDWELPDAYFEDVLDQSLDTDEVSTEENLATDFKSFIEKGLKEVIRLSNQHQQGTYDIHKTIPYSILDAFQGIVKTIQLEDRELDVPIPVGAFSGQRLKFSGQGKTSEDRKTKGNLFITLVEKPHSYFFRNGNNLLFHASIDIYTALLGGTISIPTMDGRVRIPIPRGLANNAQIKVAGAGMPVFNNPGQRGDLFVEIHLEIPKDLSEEEIALIEQLRKLRRK